MPFVSAIVPVYKCEDDLHICVDCVLGQTFRDFELILVDDGSPDGSGALCDTYAKQDARVRVIHKPNGGTSSARNAGLDVAQGSYVMFLDNDDRWKSATTLEQVADKLQRSLPDILVFLHEEHWAGSGKTTMPVAPIQPRAGAPHYPLSETGDFFESATNLANEYAYAGSVWQCTFRRGLVQDARIRFPVGRRNEDLDFCFEALRAANSIDYLNEPLYVWRRGVLSSQSAGIPARGPALDLAELLVGWAEEARRCEPRRQEMLAAYLGPIYAVWLGYAYLYHDEEMLGWRKHLQPYAYLLDGGTRHDVRAIRDLCKVFGQGFVGRLLALRYRILAHRR